MTCSLLEWASSLDLELRLTVWGKLGNCKEPFDVMEDRRTWLLDLTALDLNSTLCKSRLP